MYMWIRLDKYINMTSIGRYKAMQIRATTSNYTHYPISTVTCLP